MIVRANAARVASTDITIKSDESLAKELNDNLGAFSFESFAGGICRRLVSLRRHV